MKVLIINGSPKSDGCTARAINEVELILNNEGIDTEVVHVGNKNIRGCIDCNKCTKLGKCVFDDLVNETNEKFKLANGLIIASPVYYASANGTLVSFLDRLFYSSNFDKTMKVGASIVSCRRGGSTASFDELNKYFSISSMPIVSSNYWNQVHGYTKIDVDKDLEGLQTMRTLGKNMSFLIKSIELGKQAYGLPLKEKKVFTNFIS